MSRKNVMRFRPELESLDCRALPTPLLMQACASGAHLSEAGYDETASRRE